MRTDHCRSLLQEMDLAIRASISSSMERGVRFGLDTFARCGRGSRFIQQSVERREQIMFCTSGARSFFGCTTECARREMSRLGGDALSVRRLTLICWNHFDVVQRSPVVLVGSAFHADHVSGLQFSIADLTPGGVAPLGAARRRVASADQSAAGWPLTLSVKCATP